MRNLDSTLGDSRFMGYICWYVFMGQIWGPRLQTHPEWRTKDMQYDIVSPTEGFRDSCQGKCQVTRKPNSPQCYGPGTGLVFHRHTFIKALQSPHGAEVLLHMSQVEYPEVGEGLAICPRSKDNLGSQTGKPRFFLHSPSILLSLYPLPLGLFHPSGIQHAKEGCNNAYNNHPPTTEALAAYPAFIHYPALPMNKFAPWLLSFHRHGKYRMW